MKGCIEEIFKRYNLSVLVMSQREVRKRRVLSWVAGSEEEEGFQLGDWVGRVTTSVLGPQGEAESS